jgi:hypothetical protein
MLTFCLCAPCIRPVLAGKSKAVLILEKEEEEKISRHYLFFLREQSPGIIMWYMRLSERLPLVGVLLRCFPFSIAPLNERSIGCINRPFFPFCDANVSLKRVKGVQQYRRDETKTSLALTTRSHKRQDLTRRHLSKSPGCRSSTRPCLTVRSDDFRFFPARLLTNAWTCTQ